LTELVASVSALLGRGLRLGVGDTPAMVKERNKATALMKAPSSERRNCYSKR